MCGRYALTTSAEVLAQLFRAAINFELRYRYNIAPTQMAPVARPQQDDSSGGKSEIAELRWGLIPSWAKDPSIGSRMINARSETAAEKPSFRSAFKRRRCLVPASGFFEWKELADDKSGKGGRAKKQPYYIYRADEQPLVMAGLWESWTDPESNKPLETYSILTTDANEQLRELHDRMPAILEPEQFDAWLDPGQNDAASLKSLLKPVADGVLAMHPVSTRVNSPKHDEPSLVKRVDASRTPGTGESDEPSLFG
jgi:putative SOS response-associated peptidase YedK